MGRKLTFVAERADRLDRVLADADAALSRRQAKLLIDEGAVFVDGHRCRVASRGVAAGARVVAHLDFARSAPKTALDVLWSAGDLFAIAKPPGLHVNETETSAEASVVSTLRSEEKGAVHPVHRLDRDTSGVLLVAKTAGAAAEAAALFEQRAVHKTYWAIVTGTPTLSRIDAAIGPDRRRPRARAVRDDGKSARTDVCVIRTRDGLSVVRAHPITGRTHQVRVHLAFASSPILGDLLYGGPAASRVDGRVIRWSRVMLHAAEIAVSLAGPGCSRDGAGPG